MRVETRAAWLAVMTLVLAHRAEAFEGRIPISAPVTITVAGSYVVTEDITAEAGVNGGSAIIINASHVTVDLDGHTLTGASGADVITNGLTGTFRDIVVRNGKIAGGAIQVRLTTAGGESSVENISCVPGPSGQGQGISIAGTAVVSTARGLVRYCTVVQSASYGIVLTNIDSGRVEGNDVRLCAQEGIRLAGVHNALVSENSVSFNSFGIVTVNSNNNIIRDNTLSDNSNSGINLTTSTNSLITGNTTSLNGEGIALNALSHGNTISYNNASQNTRTSQGTGIRLERSNYNNIMYNTVTRNNGHGIQIYGTTTGSDFNSVTWNILEANGAGLVPGNQCGLSIASLSERNIYSYNRAGNATGGVQLGGAYCNSGGTTNNPTGGLDAYGNASQ